MLLRIVLFSLCLLLPLSFTAKASVVGEPECFVHVSVKGQEDGVLTGVIEKSKGAGFFGFLSCSEYKGQKVAITKVGDELRGLWERALSVNLGVQRGSSMGENGAVEFLHWEITYIDVSGKDMSLETYPSITVEIISDHK